MLINFIANAFDKELNEKLKSKLNLSENFIIDWKQTNNAKCKTFKLDERHNLPFIFIYQSKIKEIADDHIKLKEEVLEILRGAGYFTPQELYDEIYVKEKFQNYWNIKNWLNKKNEDGTKINDINTLMNKIAKIQENIDLATDREHKEQLEKYIENIDKIEKEKSNISKLTQLEEELTFFASNINERIIELGITKIDFSKQILEIKEKITHSLDEISKLESENKLIKEKSFKDFKGDLIQLLNNLENYRNEINEINKHIIEIEKYIKELNEIKVEINKILTSYKEQLLSEAESINDTWKNNIFDNPSRGEKENELIRDILKKRDIKIESEIFFNKTEFFNNAAKFIDGRVVKSKYEKIPKLLSLDKDNMLQNIIINILQLSMLCSCIY
jgi:chromosome segregation ATPase